MILDNEGFEVNMRDLFVSPEPNIQRNWVERCDLHVRKTKELRDRKMHIDLRQDLVKDLRGSVCNDLEDLLTILQNVVMKVDCRDWWRWTLQESGEFTVPKKVNIFVWRALKGRLAVREELDKRGIDLDSLLCPSCGDMVESCSHCVAMCNFARSVWEKIFGWWKIGNVNAFSIEEFFSFNGNANVPSLSSKMWQAVRSQSSLAVSAILVTVFAVSGCLAYRAALFEVKCFWLMGLHPVCISFWLAFGSATCAAS
ncbi:reverse transcriptase domain, reverse transcriptase zinc-binding domain protein [Tanacetum coccineum]